ncbi:MAG TPA: Hsp20/alpha crystallin family protein [Anaerolineae bacterium]|nr:Hsp20/alpha crystallin family protein [Anaerolineae bacterium]
MDHGLGRWEPFRDFMTLREAMDRLFEESFVGPRRRELLPAAEGTLALDIYRTEDAAVVKTAVPGVKPDDLDITISGNMLTISGETREEDEVREENYLRRERRLGSFSRSVVLPEGLELDKAEASFEDGVLTLTIPKAPEAKPKVIKVQSKTR